MGSRMGIITLCILIDFVEDFDLLVTHDNVLNGFVRVWDGRCGII